MADAPTTVQLNPNLVEIAGRVRVERGPALKTDTASEVLLGQFGMPAHYKVGALDARGQVITLGKPIAYLDWHGDWGWYVYTLANPADPASWVEDSFFAAEADALARGGQLAA